MDFLRCLSNSNIRETFESVIQNTGNTFLKDDECKVSK
jgi:hypothetical protein